MEIQRMDCLVQYFIVTTRKHEGGQAEIIFSYPPKKNEAEQEFCDNISMFTFPHSFDVGWSQATAQSTCIPPAPPIHHIFALTDISGDHLYGASLSFFEASSPETQTVFHAKSLCLISKKPIYTFLLRYLEQLFVVGVLQAQYDDADNYHAVEKTLCNLFHEVPTPSRGQSIQVNVNDCDILIERPSIQDFPFDTDMELMTYTFMCVDLKVLYQLYHHVLLEHRILITAQDTILITSVAETIKSLIFPFTWLHVFVPNIPDSLELGTLLEAPVPFIVGAHISQVQNLIHSQLPPMVVKFDVSDGKIVLGSDAVKITATLPEACTKFLNKLSAIRIPDATIAKKEIQQKIWDRRMNVQKACIDASSCSNNNMSHGSSSSKDLNDTINSSSRNSTMKNNVFFLVQKTMLFKKVIKSFTEVLEQLLIGYFDCIINEEEQIINPNAVKTTTILEQNSTLLSNIQANSWFDNDKFLNKKNTNDKVFYEEFIHTAHFQAFMSQHLETFNNKKKKEDQKMVLEYFYTNMSKLEYNNNNNQQQQQQQQQQQHETTTTSVVVSPTCKSSSGAICVEKASKPFVALKPILPSQPNQSTTISRKNPFFTVFPTIRAEAFGQPREVSLPTLVDCKDFSSTSTVGSTSHFTNYFHSRMKPIGKDYTGMEWMQSFIKNVTTSASIRKQELKQEIQSPFKRSRTAERLKAGAAFYRSMTQNRIISTFSDGGNGSSAINTTNVEGQNAVPLKGGPPLKCVWLVTTSTCKCRNHITHLTDLLIERTRNNGEDNSEEEESDIYVSLITSLGACGHMSEAKAAFDECLGQKMALNLIAEQQRYWKPFSSLMRTFILNGFLLKAFDLLMQVQLDEEQSLDPSFGSFSFLAQVLGCDKTLLTERIYVTFSCGNLGMNLGPRENGKGCELLSLLPMDKLEKKNLSSLRRFTVNTSRSKVSQILDLKACVREHDVIEAVNGENVSVLPFQEIIQRIKQAHRPMTITFLRGLDNIQQSVIGSDLTAKKQLVQQVKHTSQGTSNVESKRMSVMNKPRKDLCDRFGLLPQRGLRVTILADCEMCSKRATLQEVQQSWSKEGEDAGLKIACPNCTHKYTPRLCVMLGVTTAFCQSLHSGEPQVFHSEYLSMSALRKELISLSTKMSGGTGVKLLVDNMQQLRNDHPKVYWNVVVKLLSLACPLDFLDLPDITQNEHKDQTENLYRQQQENEHQVETEKAKMFSFNSQRPEDTDEESNNDATNSLPKKSALETDVEQLANALSILIKAHEPSQDPGQENDEQSRQNQHVFAQAVFTMLQEKLGLMLGVSASTQASEAVLNKVQTLKNTLESEKKESFISVEKEENETMRRSSLSLSEGTEILCIDEEVLG